MSDDNDNSDDAIATARHLLRARDKATLATLLAASGEPYASLVLVAAAPDASPILLLSDLAEHAANIARDNRVSLLLDGTQGLDDALTGARLSLQGRAERADDAGLRARYLARHPSAGMYADFGDFCFYRVRPARAHLVAGFGRIDWLDWADLAADPAPELAAAEAEIVAHMNQDHGDALQAMARGLAGARSGHWSMTGIDPEGLDLRLGGDCLRLDFPAPIRDPGEARSALVALAKQARTAG